MTGLNLKFLWVLGFVLPALFLPDAKATPHVLDAVDYLQQRLGSTMLLAHVEQMLAAAFDTASCAMSWSKDVDNWTPLRWRCRVDATTGHLLGCVWLFAGSSEVITAQGQWRIWGHVARCTIPFTGDAVHTLQQLGRMLPAAQLLAAPLPGLDLCFEAILTACFAGAAADPLPRQTALPSCPCAGRGVSAACCRASPGVGLAPAVPGR